MNEMVVSGWPYLLLGIGSGVLSGLFGVGGGIVMVPALILLAGLTQKSAQAMSLAIMVPMALIGALRYRFNPEVRMDLVIALWMVIGGLGGSLAGASIAGALPGTFLRKCFAVFMICVAVHLLLTSEKTGVNAGATGSLATGQSPAVEKGECDGKK